MIYTVKMLQEKGFSHAPLWVNDNILYSTIVGSVAYGVSNDFSDVDLTSIVMPPKSILFPYEHGGHIYGFGKPPTPYSHHIEHGIQNKDDGSEYDLSIYSIVKTFDMLCSSNPNILEMLYTPNNCIIQQTQTGKMIRDYRDNFISMDCYKTFMEYLASQIHKAKTKFRNAGHVRKLLEAHGEITLENIKSKKLPPKEEIMMTEYLHSKRMVKFIEQNQEYDCKFVANIVRLAYQCETILTEGTLNLTSFSTHIRAIREGKEPFDKVMQWLDEKEIALIKIKASSKIRANVDIPAAKEFLMNCIENHYGTIDNFARTDTIPSKAIKEIVQIIQKHNLYQ